MEVVLEAGRVLRCMLGKAYGLLKVILLRVQKGKENTSSIFLENTKVIMCISNVGRNIDSDKWNIACHISKQRMSQSSMIAAFQHEPLSPEETQEGRNTCHLAVVRLQPHPLVSPEETQDMKTQDTGPR